MIVFERIIDVVFIFSLFVISQRNTTFFDTMGRVAIDIYWGNCVFLYDGAGRLAPDVSLGEP